MDIASVLGPNSTQILWWQMAARAAAIFGYGVALIRLTGGRIFARQSPLDLTVAITVGSTLSRTLTGESPFFPTLGAATVLVFLHWVTTRMSRHVHWLEWLVKGRAERIVADGRPLWEVMARHGISYSDLTESIREAGALDERQVSAAFVEPSGRVSVVKR